MQSIPIKPVELIRSQVSSANSQRLLGHKFDKKLRFLDETRQQVHSQKHVV